MNQLSAQDIEEIHTIAAGRQPGGVWDITWQWDASPKEFAVSERWWQGIHAVSKSLLLRSFSVVTNTTIILKEGMNS